MLTSCALIYIGGVAYLYIHLIYYAFFSPEEQISGTGDDFQSRVTYNLVDVDGADGRGGRLIINAGDNCGSDSSDELEEEEDPSSMMDSYQVQTFKKSSDFDLIEPSKSESPINRIQRRKTVRFDPISWEHTTFSSKYYERRNSEWFDIMQAYQKDPDMLAAICDEVEAFKDHEMEVHPMSMTANSQEIDD